jgi:hypothetical protein
MDYRSSSALGGVMRIVRTIIVPAALALGVAGSLLSGSAMSVAAGSAASAHVQTVAMSPLMTYHG